MSTEETIEGNKLIAEFMGGILHKKAANNHSFHTSPNGIPIVPDSFLVIGELKYHTLWDWLMPVVEKIEEDGNWAFNIFQKEAWLADNYYRETARGKRIAHKAETKIEAVWLAVVEFIKWYNQNKS